MVKLIKCVCLFNYMDKAEKIMKVLLKEFRSYREPTIRRTSRKVNAFRTLITCLLSLRTQDSNTERASESLFAVADTPEKILSLPLKKLEKLIFCSGHYRKKSKVLKSVCRELLNRFDGKVPFTKEELISIKGVGPKTANIVLCFAYGKDVIPVDTHVHRIPNRWGLIKTKKPEDTEVELMKIFNKKYWNKINTNFILFGKNVCVPVSPKCSICPVSKFCDGVGVENHR